MNFVFFDQHSSWKLWRHDVDTDQHFWSQHFIAESPLLFCCPWGQSPNKKWEAHSFLVKKKKRQNGGRTSQKALRVPFPPSKRPIFAGRGRIISGRLAKRFGSRFGTNTKLWRGVISPISTPNDYSGQICEAPRAPGFERFIISSRAKRVYHAWC